MISKSFIKSSLVYTIIGALPLASSIILLPFYGNHTLLSTSDFGLLAIYIVLSELARVLFTFATDNFMGLNYIHYSSVKEEREKFIGTSTLFMLLYSGGLLLLFSSIGNYIFSVAYPGKDLHFFPYGFLSLLTGLFNGIFKSYTTLQIYRERPLPYFWSNVVHFSLVLIVTIVGLYLKPLSLAAPVWGRFSGALVTFIWSIVFLISQSRLKFDLVVLKRLLSYSAPLYIYNILFWIINNIDRYFILGLMSEKSVAIFDFAVKISMAIEFIQNGLSGAISPKIFKLWKQRGDKPTGDIEINKYFHTFTMVNILFVPFYYILVPLLVPVVVNNKELYASFALLPLLFAGRIVRVWYYYLSMPIFYFQKTKIMPIVFGITAAFQIVTTYLLIKFDGINGAVWGSFFTKIVQVVLLFVFVRNFYKFNVNFKKIFVFPFAYILSLIVIHEFLPSISYFTHTAIQILVIFVTGYFVYRNEFNISSIINLLKKDSSSKQ